MTFSTPQYINAKLLGEKWLHQQLNLASPLQHFRLHLHFTMVIVPNAFQQILSKHKEIILEPILMSFCLTQENLYIRIGLGLAEMSLPQPMMHKCSFIS